MKKRFVFKPAVPFLAAAFFALAACNDPIFYTVSQEVAPIEPRIKGGPTNLTVWNNYMYVASGNTLHRYNNGNWASGAAEGVSKPQPGGTINSLAATTNYLYALCYTSDSVNSSVIRQFGGTSWKDLSDTTITKDGFHSRSIYAPDPSSGYVFIGAEKRISEHYTFAVFYTDDGGSINKIDGIDETTEAELKGAAYDGANYYYLCTKGGIYYATSVSGKFEQVKDSGGKNFAGIIKLDPSYIAAIGRNGQLYKVDNAGISGTSNIPNSYLSTGALAIWEDPQDSNSRLLLAGQQSNVISASAYSNGYVELTLDTNGNPVSGFREPGTGSPSSVVSNDRYKSTIGRLPINFMFQAPKEVDSGRRLFASTQSGGVWSYRERNRIPQWNAED
jgi:hypothetical protein